MPRPIVTLLTDFGARDPSAAICKGVVLSIAPDAQVIDISHEVDKYAIRDGALLLWCALPYLPIGAHMAVVDPGVGTARRPVAVRAARGDTLVGPDNGLLMPAAERLGGVTRVHLLEAPEYRLPVTSASFHGRDVFAPAAAHLALGVGIERLGRELDAAELVDLSIERVSVMPGRLDTAIVYVDTFGNVKLGGVTADLTAAVGAVAPGDRLVLEIGGPGASAGVSLELPWQLTFGLVAVGSPLLYEDSYGRLCLADNQGDVARRLGLVPDLPVAIRRA